MRTHHATFENFPDFNFTSFQLDNPPYFASLAACTKCDVNVSFLSKYERRNFPRCRRFVHSAQYSNSGSREIFLAILSVPSQVSLLRVHV